MDLRINLANKPYLNRRIIWRALMITCAFLLLIMGLNLFYGVTNYRQLSLLKSRNAELNQQLAELKGAPEQYSPESFARVQEQVQVVNQIIDADQFHWTALLSRLEELVPDDVSINSIQPDFKERSLRIETLAKDVSAMTLFLDRLLKSEDLNRVFLFRQAETEPQDGSPSLTNFSVVIEEAF